MRETDIQETSSPSLTPRAYPVSTRAYKKKDYEYISTFNRTAQPGIRTNRMQHDRVHYRSDAGSDCSFTRSSVESGFSNSFESSSSSITSTEKNYVGMGNQHPYLSDQSSLDSLQMAEAPSRLKNETKLAEPEFNENMRTSEKESFAGVKDEAPETNTNTELPERKPTFFPKFGGWDSQNPSSEEAYTAIFEKLRDEKKSGRLSLHADSKEERLSKQERQSESSLTGSSTGSSNDENSVPKNKSNQLSKSRSVHHQNSPMCWNFCCMAAALND